MHPKATFTKLLKPKIYTYNNIQAIPNTANDLNRFLLRIFDIRINKPRKYQTCLSQLGWIQNGKTAHQNMRERERDCTKEFI